MEVLIQISPFLATLLLPPFSGEHSILPIALISAILTTAVSSCPRELEYAWSNLMSLSSTRGGYRLQELDRWKLPQLITLLPSLRKRLFVCCGLEPLLFICIALFAFLSGLVLLKTNGSARHRNFNKPQHS